MSTDLKTIEQEADEYYALRDYIKSWFGVYEKELKEKDSEFVMEVTKENPEWIKERRLAYLDEELEFLNKQYVDVYAGVEESKHKISESWLVEVLNDFVKPTLKEIAKKIKKHTFEKSCWEAPETMINSNGVTQDEIETARGVGCENFIEVKRSAGDKKLAVCPFHNDHSPSLTIYPAGKGYHCFSCGANGDTINLVMKLQNIDFVSAVKLILQYQ